LKNIAEKAESIQIFLENDLGKSEASEYFEIKCEFKGCIKTGPTSAIVAGSICAVSVVVFILFTIFFIRRLPI
jgi:hypothetical protein